ncbi:MAG: SiaB family protein kinase [Bacteroidales bacterium]
MDNVNGYFGLINDHYEHLSSDDIIIAYDGDVTHQIMKAFSSLVEEKLEHEKEDEGVIRRLYHVLVECLQNINRHAEAFFPDTTDDRLPGKGALLVSQSAFHYSVITANMIRSSQVAEIRAFLKSINKLSEKQLNELYKDQLKEGRLTSKGGAGLGFIDIRRKTANEMKFNFVENDADTTFFIFNVIIARQ